jgi:hypothetical protein
VQEALSLLISLSSRDRTAGCRARPRAHATGAWVTGASRPQPEQLPRGPPQGGGGWRNWLDGGAVVRRPPELAGGARGLTRQPVVH